MIKSAITYKNTKTTIPGWVQTLHNDQPRGYAYATQTHFVHFYGRDDGLFTISTGLTVLEKKNGVFKVTDDKSMLETEDSNNLEAWVKKIFGAIDILKMDTIPGETYRGAWRPGIYFHNDVLSGLNVSDVEIRTYGQALRLLIEKLDQIFIFIEPNSNSLEVYSHKIRELLILACTEVENYFASYFENKEKRYTTNDYIKLLASLHLKEYQVTLKNYFDMPPINPFSNWSNKQPTKSLGWYDAYNKVKHNLNDNFKYATLLNCINAVVANIILYCVKFSPFILLNQNDFLSSIVNQHFKIELVNPRVESFYLHEVHLPDNVRDDLFCYDSSNNCKDFRSNFINFLRKTHEHT